MKYVALTLAVLLVIGLAYGQKQPRRKAAKPAMKQGICGTIVVKRGNYMPAPDTPARTGQPAEREVLIFPVLTMDQVEMGDSGFINDTKGAKPIKTVKADKQGKFCVADLPAGQYSVVVREPKGLYANSFDAKNRINAVTVQSGKIATISIDITHQAVF